MIPELSVWPFFSSGKRQQPKLIIRSLFLILTSVSLSCSVDSLTLGLTRGRRYKALPDTSFIRFGRSKNSALDSDREVADEEEQELLDIGGDTGGLAPNFRLNSPLSTDENLQVNPIKKGKPDKYYLRFGKRWYRGILYQVSDGLPLLTHDIHWFCFPYQT